MLYILQKNYCNYSNIVIQFEAINFFKERKKFYNLSTIDFYKTYTVKAIISM